MRRRDPGTQLPLLINPQDSPPETDTAQLQALLEAVVERLKRWDGTDNPPAQDEDGTVQDIRALMSESIAAFSELDISVEFRTS